MLKPTANIVAALRPIMANTVLLQLKTHQYHHNTTGTNFYASHQVFDTQYKDLVDATDTIGERIRKLYGYVPVTKEYFVLGNIKDAVVGMGEFDIYKDLAADNFNLANQCISAALIAQNFDDAASVNLLGDRQEQHEDFAWRLLSMLPDDMNKDFTARLRGEKI
jgi:starvation-inducible DNA-binding protein